MNEKLHAIMATAGAARRSATGRSGPTVSDPTGGVAVVASISERLSGVACYQDERVIVALDMPGDDEVGDLLRRVRQHQRFCEAVFDSV